MISSASAWSRRLVRRQVAFTDTTTPAPAPEALHDDDDDDELNARSAFGTKSYWDDVYHGRGDFPADEYSWYYGWESLANHVQTHIPRRNDASILIPGIGNDPILLDFLSAGYANLTACDYSAAAVERQEDLLLHWQTQYNHGASAVHLQQADVRRLPDTWTGQFQAIVEKGLLDAVYLSSSSEEDGVVECAVAELHRVLRPGGILLHVSGVVPHQQQVFGTDKWVWLRDGSDDLRAGCFVLQKK